MDDSGHEVAVQHGDKVEEPGSQELQAVLLLRGVEAHVRQIHIRILGLGLGLGPGKDHFTVVFEVLLTGFSRDQASLSQGGTIY